MNMGKKRNGISTKNNIELYKVKDYVAAMELGGKNKVSE